MERDFDSMSVKSTGGSRIVQFLQTRADELDRGR